MLLLFSVLGCLFNCGGKKDKEAEASEDKYVFELGTCPISRINVLPAGIDSKDVTVGSNYELALVAKAYDNDGKPANAPLTWSLRYPDGDYDQLTGAGHSLEVRDNQRAIFKASGLAPGLFTVVARDNSCNLGTEEEPQYVEGQTWIRVYDPPGAEAACGRMRVTYGDRLDRMGDEVIAGAKMLLIAEVSGHDKLGFRYKVQFYLDDKPYPGRRPLYRDNETTPVPGMEVGHVSLLPIYLVPGEHNVRYELLKKGEVVCGSRTERFKSR
jgi:hypothetical protein